MLISVNLNCISIKNQIEFSSQFPRARYWDNCLPRILRLFSCDPPLTAVLPKAILLERNQYLK